MEEKQDEKVLTENAEPEKVQTVETENAKEEKVVETEKSDDERYAEIQTEKLLKKRKIRRISTFAALCFSFVLAATLIVLACVPVSLKPSCIKGSFRDVTLYPTSSSLTSGVSLDAERTPEKYQKFMDMFDKAFSQPCLSALLGGNIGVENVKEEYNVFSGFSGTFGNRDANAKYMRVRFDEKPFLVKGKEYESIRFVGQTFKIDEVYVEINNVDGFSDTNVFVVVEYDKSSSTKQYYITVTVKANTYDLYNNWTEFVEKD